MHDDKTQSLADYRKGYSDAVLDNLKKHGQTFMYYAGFDNGVIALEHERESAEGDIGDQNVAN